MNFTKSRVVLLIHIVGAALRCWLDTLTVCRPDKWEDVRLAIVQFVLTRDGYLTEESRIPNLRRVTSIGFSVMGGSYLQDDGPYQLCVSRLAAGYDMDRSSGNED